MPIQDSPSSSTMKNKPSNSSLTEEDNAAMKRIFDFTKRPQDLDDSDTWPCVHIRDYAEYIHHPSNEQAPIPYFFVSFLEFDLRNYPTALDRVDHVRFYMCDEPVSYTHLTLPTILLV